MMNYSSAVLGEQRRTIPDTEGHSILGHYFVSGPLETRKSLVIAIVLANTTSTTTNSLSVQLVVLVPVLGLKLPFMTQMARAV